jgi:hypothetical protein
MAESFATRAYLLHCGFALFVVTVILAPATSSPDSGDAGELILFTGLYYVAFIMFPTAAAYYSLRTKPRDLALWLATFMMFGVIAIHLFRAFGLDTVPPDRLRIWSRVAAGSYAALIFFAALKWFMSMKNN